MTPVAIALSGLLAATPAAEEVDTDAVFEALDWLEGCWAGPGFDGEMSECWMRTASGELVGAFQYSADGALQFSEMLMIGHNPHGEFGYQVKHFNRDFTGWEENGEQITFEFQALEGDRVVFSGLVLEPDGVDAMRAYLDMRSAEGVVNTVEFHFQRVR